MAARRRARRAAALFRLGAPETAWGLLGLRRRSPRAGRDDPCPGRMRRRARPAGGPTRRRGRPDGPEGTAAGPRRPGTSDSRRGAPGARPAPGRRVPRRARPGHPRRVAATPPRPRPGPIRRAGRPFPGRRGRGHRAAMVHRPGAHHGRHRPEKRQSPRIDRSHVCHRRSRSHPGAIPAVPPEPQTQAAREHEPRLPRGRTDMVRRGRLLPLARRSRSSPGGRVLLSADPGDQGGHARAPGIPPADGPPAADVRRVGVRLPDRDRHRPPFRQSR